MEHSLRVPVSQLRLYQARYDASVLEADLEIYREVAKKQRYLTTQQLYEICRWKSPRRAKNVFRNSEEFAKEITAFSFGATQEESRIGSLALLSGVEFPTASVILHYCVDASYPILDVRAIWSLGVKQPAQYTFLFWKEYMALCRSIANENSMSVRELDMALWQYSKEHQPALEPSQHKHRKK